MYNPYADDEVHCEVCHYPRKRVNMLVIKGDQGHKHGLPLGVVTKTVLVCSDKESCRDAGRLIADG